MHEVKKWYQEVWLHQQILRKSPFNTNKKEGNKTAIFFENSLKNFKNIWKITDNIKQSSASNIYLRTNKCETVTDL